MSEYLKSSEYIDWKHPTILVRAKILAKGLSSDEAIAKKCFEFVRDEIKHSGDYQFNPVTCRASDVLKFGTGFCYAKSHLLAALLRANNIPAGLSYQRLTITHEPPFCLHSLNVVYLKAYGWYRMDARGNKMGVMAQFCPPEESLAFAIKTEGELDMPGMYCEPLPEVIKLLTEGQTVQAVCEHYLDIELGGAK